MNLQGMDILPYNHFRWYSTHVMLISFLEQMNAIELVLTGTKHQNLLLERSVILFFAFSFS